MANGGSRQRETGVLRRPDVSTPRLQPAMSQSRMPAGQVPPSRQLWQDLIAKRKAEIAWQSRDGTSGRRWALPGGIPWRRVMMLSGAWPEAAIISEAHETRHFLAVRIGLR